MDGEVRLQLSEDGADAERLDALTGYLRAELLQLELSEVSAAEQDRIVDLFVQRHARNEN